MTYTLSTTGLWVNRAHQAWGASRQYGVGSSFETDAANNAANATTWQGRANQAWGPSRGWSSGVSFEDQAWTGSGVGSGILWSDAAHDDPSVWTNRYNAGYAQATTDKQPAGLWSATFNQAATCSTADTTYYSAAVPYAGYYVLAMNAHMGDGADGQWGYFEIRRNGGVLAACMARFRVSGVESYPGCYWVGQLNAGDTASVVGHAGGFAGPITMMSVAFTFVPTPAQPH